MPEESILDKGFKNVLKLPAEVQYALNRGNAERLWPRFNGGF